jgi:uncharacterized RDD family membrane protein YckC
MNYLTCPDCGEGNLSNRLYCLKCGAGLQNAQVQKGIALSATHFGSSNGAISLENNYSAQNWSDSEFINGAGCGIRLLARVIDHVTHFIVSFVAILFVEIIAGIVAIIMLGMSSDAISQKMSEPTFLDFVLALLGFIMYHTLCEGIHGSTLGKLICGLVVVKENGQTCGLLAAFGRSLAFLIDSLFFCIPALISMNESTKQQRLGDRWAKTMVVKRHDLKGIVPLRSGLWFVPAFLGGVMLDGALTGLSILLKFVVR